jgi:hypothetical protein
LLLYRRSTGCSRHCVPEPRPHSLHLTPN